MKYKLQPTRIIHWDEEGMFKVDLKTDKIYSVITAEVYKVYNNSLPIIIVCQIRIKTPEQVDVFSSIFHTKTVLTFEPKENPINDLMKMFAEADKQEKEQWGKRIVATPLHGLFLDNIPSNDNVKLNKSCEIRDIAKLRKLVE